MAETLANMEDKCFLIDCFEREIATPTLYDSLDEARKAMKTSLLEAMDGADDSVFDEYEKDEDYSWTPEQDFAWFNHRHGSSDWRIISFKDILSHTARGKS